VVRLGQRLAEVQFAVNVALKTHDPSQSSWPFGDTGKLAGCHAERL
jgi:hypothetical protein